jgi:hypothetical protein
MEVDYVHGKWREKYKVNIMWHVDPVARQLL